MGSVSDIITIENFRLRTISQFDAPELFYRFTSQLRVMKYLPIKIHGTLQETQELVHHYQTIPNAAVLTIRRNEDRLLVGTVALARYQHAVAIALKIAPDRQSMGAGCIVAPELTRWVLSQEGIRRVWAYSDIDNKPVKNLLRNMGARCEGVAYKYSIHPNISPEPRDCYMWSIVR